MLEKLEIVKQRFDEVSDLIIQPDIIADQKRYIQLNKEYKDRSHKVIIVDENGSIVKSNANLFSDDIDTYIQDVLALK